MIETLIIALICGAVVFFLYRLQKDHREEVKIKSLCAQERAKGMKNLMDLLMGRFYDVPDFTPRVFKKQIIVENSRRGVLYRSIKMEKEEFDTVMSHYLDSGNLHFNTIVDGHVSIGKKVLEEVIVSIIDV